MSRLTLRRLRALEAAIQAMLAGEEGEGDWPPEIASEDAQEAANWVSEQLRTREPEQPDPEREFWRREGNMAATRESQ